MTGLWGALKTQDTLETDNAALENDHRQDISRLVDHERHRKQVAPSVTDGLFQPVLSN